MQEIIVYRSPAEAALAHSMASGEFFPILCGMVNFVAIFVVINYFMCKFFRPSYRKAAFKHEHLSLAISAVISIGIVYGMWI